MKAAAALNATTGTSIEFYLKLPTRDFVELNNEVIEAWEKARSN